VLLAALLASAVSLPVYAIYQYTVEFPQQQKALVPTSNCVPLWSGSTFQFGATKATRVLPKRSRHTYIATFSHPNSFAGYTGAFAAGRRRLGPGGLANEIGSLANLGRGHWCRA